MAQQLFLQTETSLPAAKTSTHSNVKGNALQTKGDDPKGFSSELTKQIDKHVTPDKKDHPLSDSAKPGVAKPNNVGDQAEDGTQESGNILPEVVIDDVEILTLQGQDIDIEPTVLFEEVVLDADLIVSQDQVVFIEDSDLPNIKVVTESIKLIDVEQASITTVEANIEKNVDVAVIAGDENNIESQPIMAQPLFSLSEEFKPHSIKVEASTAAKSELPQAGAGIAISEEAKNIAEPLKAAIIKQLNPEKPTTENPRVVAAPVELTDQLVKPLVVDGKAVPESRKAEAHKQPILRPDILQAIAEKFEQKNTNKPAIFADKNQALSKDQAYSKILTDGLVVPELVKTVKSDLLGSVLGRDNNAGHFISAFTSANYSQGQSLPSAMQSTATGQPLLNMQPVVQSAAWNQVLSSRVVWMAREGIQQAQLKLNPANLGPVEVKLQMNNEQASVTFIAHHAATRDALEQALPRLRDSMQENGMELVNAEVTEHSFEQQQQDDQAENTNQAQMHHNATVDESETTQDAQPQNIEQDELSIGLSLYA